jgi:RNA polymerase sigma-70 factor (ECF subfamily)
MLNCLGRLPFKQTRELSELCLVLPTETMERALTTFDPPAPREDGGPQRVSVRPARKGDIDSAILKAAQAGDPRAIEEFVLHYQRPVFAFLSRSAGSGPHVEDLSQEVFLRALRALPQFIKSDAKISTWLFQIAVRLLQDRRKRPMRVLVGLPETLRDDREDPEETCSRRRVLRRIEALAKELPEEQRMALVLIEFHGLSHEEVAEIMGSGVGTVKTRLHRARQFLRDGIAKEAGEDS